MNFKKILLFLFLLLEMSYIVSADNWVCWDSTGSVTASQLRTRFAQIGVQPESPLQIINTKSTSNIYSKSSYFRSCESASFTYCPENDYYLKSSFTSATRCSSVSGAHHIYIGSNNLISGVDCGLGGGPSCNNFYNVGGSGTATQSFVCGKNNNLWATMTTSNNWICNSGKELGIRYTTPPVMGNITSFRDLSFSNSNKFSNSHIDLSFMVYILACINRVPMLNLKVDLIDPQTGNIKNTEYGIYAKHETIDYNEENLGKLGSYYLPNQTEFKKTYSLKATLSGYRAWAWRQRLVDGIKKLVDIKNLNVPGYPYSGNQQKFGNLYYSKDFLFNLDKIEKVSLTSTQQVNSSLSGSVNVLKNINQLSGNQMCTITDLKNYVKNYGLSSELLNNLKGSIPINNSFNYYNISISKSNNKIINLNYQNYYYNTTSKSEANKIKKELDNGLNRNLDLIFKKGILNKANVINTAKSKVSSWFDYSPNLGCTNYDYKIKNLDLVSQDYDYNIVTKSNFNNVTNKTKITKIYIFKFNNLKINAVWENNIIAKLKLDYSKNKSTEFSWNFATLGSLEPIYLAKCLYNWDSCILNKVVDNGKTYTEAADLGLGPPSDLAEPSMKDGARGKKTISQNIVVYRKCNLGEEWISKNGVYACVNSSIYKCKFGVDSSEILLNIKQADVGDTLKRKSISTGFVCKNPGEWKDISCNIN